MSAADQAAPTVPDHVLIVGASIAGVRTAQALRQLGYANGVTLLGEEPHIPYDKPPLSKEMLLQNESGEPVPLVTPEQLQALDVDLRLGQKAVRLDPARHVVTTESGDELGYDRLVIATGAAARTLPGAALGGVHTIRTVEDARRIRSELQDARRAVVVGAGFIGAEFASAARTYGVAVTKVETQTEPLAHLLGETVGASLRRLHEDHEIDVIAGVQVDGLASDDDSVVTGVRLADGRLLPADLVVVGIGAVPATGWLEGSGLPVADGIECDSALRVVGFPDIYAAGDVARWPHPFYGTSLRIEHWTNAGEHGALIAADLLGAKPPAPTLPYVWSDQHGLRIQIIGRPSHGTARAVRGEAATGDLVAVYADAEGRLVGALVVNDPKLFMKCRKGIVQGLTFQEFEQKVMATS